MLFMAIQQVDRLIAKVKVARIKTYALKRKGAKFSDKLMKNLNLL